MVLKVIVAEDPGEYGVFQQHLRALEVCQLG
jgi:hypothetical protein